MNADTVDSKTLTDIIQKCFALSMNDQVPNNMQAEFLSLGKRLRGNLLNLLSAHFDSGTAELQAANNHLNDVNKDLSDFATSLQNAGTVVNSLTQVANALDQLLQLAAQVAKFV